MDTTSDPNKLIVNFLTHEMNEICTYDAVTGETCDLWLDSTTECKQVFEIYAESWSGIIDTVATFTVTFKSECSYFETHYESEGFNKLDWWTWEASDADLFKGSGYEIR